MTESRRDMLEEIARVEGHGDLEKSKTSMGYQGRGFPPRRALVARLETLEGPLSPSPESAEAAERVRGLEAENRALRARVAANCERKKAVLTSTVATSDTPLSDQLAEIDDSEEAFVFLTANRAAIRAERKREIERRGKPNFH